MEQPLSISRIPPICNVTVMFPSNAFGLFFELVRIPRRGMCHLHAVGREDLIDLLLGVSLWDALLLSDDLGEAISAARGGLEVLWGELGVLGSESGSDFVKTHVVYV